MSLGISLNGYCSNKLLSDSVVSALKAINLLRDIALTLQLEVIQVATEITFTFLSGVLVVSMLTNIFNIIYESCFGNRHNVQLKH